MLLGKPAMQPKLTKREEVMTRSQSLMGAKLLSAPPKSSAGAAHGSGHALRREHDDLRAVAEHGRRP